MPSFFREGEHYTLEKIQDKLGGITEEECKKLLATLKKCGIVKSVDRNKPEYEDLSNSDEIIEEMCDKATVSYKFSFVGVILKNKFSLCCYPKYIDNNDNPIEELKVVLEVIRKYNENEQLIYLYNGIDEGKEFNRLAVSLYLLRDYFQNGLYFNEHTVIEDNGEGEILWDNTINETYAIIKKGIPYYTDFKTINYLNNETDYFKQLHETVLTICSNELNSYGLLDLFDLSPIELSSMDLEDFGEKDYILYKLEQEINSQFITRKVTLLKSIYAFIKEVKQGEEARGFGLYGTNSFNLVWEKACSEIFESVKDTTFEILKKNNLIQKDINFKNPDYDKEFENNGSEYLNDKNKFIDLIEHVTWKINDKALKAKDTLVPDILSIRENILYILDAKYYIISANEKEISHQPGVQDVVKQFAYQRALQDFIKENGINIVKNAFLIPKTTPDDTNEDFNVIGEARLKLMQAGADGYLSPIQIVELRPNFVYEAYLNSRKCTDKLNALNAVKKGATISSDVGTITAIVTASSKNDRINNLQNLNRKTQTSESESSLNVAEEEFMYNDKPKKEK